MSTKYTINDCIFTVRNNQKHLYPKLVDNPTIDYFIHTEYPINSDVMLLVKCIANEAVNSGYSFQDSITAIIVARFLQISEDRIYSVLGELESGINYRHIHLKDTEYMYKLYLLCNVAIDFTRFFSLCPRPMEHVEKMLTLPMQSSAYIDMMIFFSKYNFTTCFEGYTSKIQTKINTLNRARNALWETFLINPFKSMFESLPHTPTAAIDIWSCEGIRCQERPQYGDKTLAQIDTVYARMDEFTCGMLKKSPNEGYKGVFPVSNVVIAGGSVAKILASDYVAKNARQSDVDLFVIGSTQEERKNVLSQLLEWFASPNTYYAVIGGVVSVYIKNIMRKFQIISCAHTNAYEVVADFDTTNVQWCYYKDKFYGTAQALRAMQEKTARFDALTNLKPERLIKVLYNGYHIVKTPEIVSDFIDITELIKDPSSPQMTKILRGLHSWYYPMTMQGLDEFEEEQHILSQIEKDSNAQIVVKTIPTVMENVTIGVNFRSSYDVTLFSTFNPAQIINNTANRRTTKVTLMTKRGVIKLTTSILRVIDIGIEVGSRVITCAAEDGEFVEFCSKLERDIYTLYKPSGVSRKLINNGEIKFILAEYKIQNHVNRGTTILNSQTNEPLCINDDLRAGDNIQVLFSINMLIYPNDHAVELSPMRFIKYVEKSDAEPEQVAIDIGNLSPRGVTDDTIEYDTLDI